jgi:MoaA/NifB/PqqE/SkfB family radical SAM enzyme
MSCRPFELHLELTNICNAKCVFCPYQFQQRQHEFMTDEVFEKAVSDYVKINGGSVSLTPIVGDALIDPKFLERVRYLRKFPEIDRILLTTNGILLDQFGIENILNSGLDSISISTSGFEAESYRRIYRSSAYERMKNNVTQLVQTNAKREKPLNIWICLRTDRSMNDVMKDPDFQPILEHNPDIDFTWSYTSAGGRVTREVLPSAMKLRVSPPKKETCVNLFNGPIVLPDGTVIACSCVAAMDAQDDLKIGHILEDDLLSIYTGPLMKNLRDQFKPGGCLNKTCGSCDMYRDLELYKTTNGRERAKLNKARVTGIVKRASGPMDPFSGG